MTMGCDGHVKSWCVEGSGPPGVVLTSQRSSNYCSQSSDQSGLVAILLICLPEDLDPWSGSSLVAVLLVFGGIWKFLDGILGAVRVVGTITMAYFTSGWTFYSGYLGLEGFWVGFLDGFLVVHGS